MCVCVRVCVFSLFFYKNKNQKTLTQDKTFDGFSSMATSKKIKFQVYTYTTNYETGFKRRKRMQKIFVYLIKST